MRINYLFFLLCMAISLVMCNKQNNHDNEVKEFISGIFKETLTKGTTYSSLKELCTKFPKRLSGSPGAEGAILWTKKLMEKNGFDNVFLQETDVEFWERGEKESAFIELNGKKEDLAILALGRSVPTPKEGITANVIEVKSLNEVQHLGRDKINGKIVFYNKIFEPQHISTGEGYSITVKVRSKGPSLAGYYGAQAVVIRSVTTAKDDYPHTGSLSYAADTVKIPAAALSYKAADRLENALKEDPDLTLTLKVNSIIHENKKSSNVIGEVKGTENPEKIILVGGHLDAWDVGEGAHDDGAGCMQSVSAIRTLLGLGYKPKNTLRAVLFINEENGILGGKHYANEAVRNNEKHVLAIESDFGGFSPRGFTFAGPEKSFQKVNNWLDLFPPFTIETVVKEEAGADITQLHKADGTPISELIPDSQRYFDFHHSDKDVFGAINQRELELGTASLASLIYLADRFGL